MKRRAHCCKLQEKLECLTGKWWFAALAVLAGTLLPPATTSARLEQ
jgi:hypothetical protein